MVWSGEGGSVMLGHVHLSESIIELMRAGNVDARHRRHTWSESKYTFQPNFSVPTS